MGPGWNQKSSTLSHTPYFSTYDLRATYSAGSPKENDKNTRNSGLETVFPKANTKNTKPFLDVPYSQRRTKSQGYLNSYGNKRQHLPQHIMPELLYDLSRTGSHISLDFTSSDEEVGTQKTKQRENVSKDSRSLVRPDAPRVIIFTPKPVQSPPFTSPTDSDSQSPIKSSQTSKGSHSAHRIILPKQPQFLRTSSSQVSTPDGRLKGLDTTSSLPSSYQLRTHGFQKQQSQNALPGSVEDFMNDASNDLSREEYDPYGLIRRNYNDWFSETSRRNTRHGEPTDSRTSSGQFSLDSTQSIPTVWTIPRAYDRRRRRNNTSVKITQELTTV
ncbi:hypothetical protein FBUS_05341 [Fasciolopsis buskii]|uniref:Uncharacterized protein n=1 Tax=Fasciolopsis buskii TaxID=27845 RepID=A0A8E0VH19_9TREM|nr:hypothetical protein FBUS_05341 [Fasciolopsis buski]